MKRSREEQIKDWGFQQKEKSSKRINATEQQIEEYIRRHQALHRSLSSQQQQQQLPPPITMVHLQPTVEFTDSFGNRYAINPRRVLQWLSSVPDGTRYPLYMPFETDSTRYLALENDEMIQTILRQIS